MKSVMSLNKEKWDKASLLDDFKMMLRIRRFEERAGQLYGMGLIAGFCHLCIGQEAISVAIQRCMTSKDKSITSYRDHGNIIAAGSDPFAVLAELMGRKEGSSKGKGGSMHVFDLEKGFYGGHGIVGAQVSIGTGMALAQKYQKTGGVIVCYYGDGAANQGQVYESFNMASLWDLPILYVVENNHYAMGTSVERACAGGDLYKRAEPFGIKGRKVGGMDYIEIRKATEEMLEEIRKTSRPQVIEMDTYRYRGHSMSDPAAYRTKEEVTKMREERDPIEKLKKDLIHHKILTEAQFEEFDQAIKSEINEIIERCKKSEEPEFSELYTDVYCSI